MCNAKHCVGGVKKYGYVLFCLTIFWQISVSAEVLNDPTRPPGIKTAGQMAGTKSAPRWVLSSTLIAPGRRLATINGQTVSVGEQIGKAQVVNIEPARVSLREGGNQIVVELAPRDFKRMH